MKFSIITPTLERESLVKCCESVFEQTWEDWEMIVQVDADGTDVPLWRRLNSENRINVWNCGLRHNNYGNSCRNWAWERATGDWVLYLDDDNWLADSKVLEDLAGVLHNVEHWALFPILRHGQRFFHYPPRTCFVDTANMVIRREIAQWPDGPEYTMDGIFCDRLREKYPVVPFPRFRPIVVMPKSSEGK